MRTLLSALLAALFLAPAVSAQVLTLPPKLEEATYYNQVTSRTNIQAFYPMDETVAASAAVRDTTGNGHHGTMAGTANLTNGNGLAPPTGEGTGGINFGGTSGEITGLYNLDCDADWTIGFYMLPGASANGPIISCGTGRTLLQYDTTNEVIYWNYGNGVKNFAYVFTPGDTYQVFVAFDLAPTEQLTLFVNGTEEESVAVSMGTWAGDLALGVSANGANYLEGMRLDALQVYDAVKSENLIARDYYQRGGNPVYSTNYIPTQFALVETQERETDDPEYCLDLRNYIGHARYLISQQTITVQTGLTGLCTVGTGACAGIGLDIDPTVAAGSSLTTGTCEARIEDPVGNQLDFEIPLRVEESFDESRIVTVATMEDLRDEFDTWTTPADSVGTLRIREGYYASGDGGALAFLFDDDNAQPLIPRYRFPAGDTTMHAESTTWTSADGIQTYTTECSPVVPGTFEITLSGTDAGSSAFEVVLPDSMMHGAAYQGQEEWLPHLDYRTGVFRERKTDGGFMIDKMLETHIGGTAGAAWSVTADVTYACATDDYVWLASHTEGGTALTDTTTWHAEWFGTQTHADSAYFDNRDVLNWALYAAKDRNRRDTALVYNYVQEMKLAQAGTYYRTTGTIQLPEYLRLVGTAGTVTNDSTYNTFTDLGLGASPGVDVTFTDVVQADNPTVLKVLPIPGTTDCDTPATRCRQHMATKQMLEPYASALHLAPDAVGLLGGGYSTVQLEDKARYGGLANLVLDGGLAEHREYVFDDGVGPYNDPFRRGIIWETPAASGYVVSTHAGHKTSDKVRSVLDSVAVVEHLNNGVLLFAGFSQRERRDELNNVLFGTAAWNHGLYAYDCVRGTNVKLSGGGWSHMAAFCADFDNLVLGDLEQGVRAGENNIIQYRGQAYHDSVAAIAGEVNVGQETSPLRFATLHADLRGVQDAPAGGEYTDDTEKAVFINQGGPHLEILGGTIIQNEDAPLVLYNAKGNDIAQGVRRKAPIIKDLNVIEQTPDTNVECFINFNSFDQGVFENIRFFGDESGQDYDCFFYMSPRRANQTGGTSPMWNRLSVGEDTLSGQGREVRVRRIVNLAAEPGTDYGDGGVSRLFIHDSRFVNSGSQLMRELDDRTGSIRDLCPGWPATQCDLADSVQVYVEDTELRVNTDQGNDQSLFFAVARLNNVTDPDEGLASEVNDTYTCLPADAGGPAVVEIDPDILFIPHPVFGDITFAGTAPAPDSYRWLDAKNSTEIEPGDAGQLTDPILEVTWNSGCTSGLTLSYDITVSAFEDEDQVAISRPTSADASEFEANGWTWVEMPLPTTIGTTDDGMVCREGAATGYGIYRRDGATNRLIYLKGGGAGFDGGTYNATATTGSFADFAETIAKREGEGGGIIKANGTASPFSDWEMVFVQYCTGDVHAGTNGSYAADGWGTQHHVGALNLQAILDDLTANEMAPDTVMLAGSSAGGFGVTLNYERVADHYISGTDTTRVFALSDAGPPMITDAVLAPEIQERWRSIWGLVNPTGCPTGDVADSCEETDGDGLENWLPYLAEEYPNVVHGVYSCERDRVIRAFYAHTEACEVSCATDPDVAISGAAYEDGLYATRALYPSNVVTYYAPGECHTGTVEASTFTDSVEGTLLVDWIEDLLLKTSVDVPTNQ